jgi:hypothetical protein
MKVGTSSASGANSSSSTFRFELRDFRVFGEEVSSSMALRATEKGGGALKESRPSPEVVTDHEAPGLWPAWLGMDPRPMTLVNLAGGELKEDEEESAEGAEPGLMRASSCVKRAFKASGRWSSSEVE